MRIRILQHSASFFGQRVNPDFTDKVKFKDPELQKTSIVIRNITEEDEGCYACLFNTTDGPLTAATCIQLYGLTAVVLTQETVMAAVGEEAHLSCQLRETRNVLQVTWKKILLDEDKNIATFSQIVGQRVNPGFTDKVEFKDPELQKNSIVIRNIAEEDKGCYLCMFNTPDGPLTAATCIQLYELHEPVLHVRESNSSAESVVSCSATGRPAPTVTLTVTQQHLNFLHHNTVSVSNTNGTVTVTATAVLSRFCDSSIQVGCAAGVLSGPRMEAFVMIPELKPTSDDDAESGSDHTRFRWPLIASLSMFCGCVAIVTVFRNKDQNRKHHINENPETATR
ncbi:OX-2 membrane glycoprotein-like isoform X2 [Melanotaenia boesemani]|uniref:OX-2 membrane glycoprotein-like isoform X2 n=1 Tax=Melanotaenia boesemani TaxID=1250792 RepID=UPI001C0466E2|nr:OX-2 membrane glycoprotein-like isoform X2 [Melanotaenia boesemani]